MVISNSLSPISFPCSSNAHKPPFLDHSSSTYTKNLRKVPTQFLWPKEDMVRAVDELNEPLVDLGGFLRWNHDSTLRAANAVREACSSHGFFQVVNHGIDPGLIQAAHDQADTFFRSPIETKLRATRRTGSLSGYSTAHSERFRSKLPWKETLSFDFHASSSESVVEYFESALGKDYVQEGAVYQRYCEAMENLALEITELLAISLGVERLHYREFFKDSHSIMRCNSYPRCEDPSLVLGTGPHTDPNSLTVLYQDQVGGLEVFVNGKWLKVRPHPDALVINIGDTFVALTNGRYKSCLHRVVVNERLDRRSLAFFMSPGPGKVVRPPPGLLQGDEDHIRRYPDFTWPDLLLFVSNHHRADAGDTLGNFSKWILSRSSSAPLAENKD